MAIVYFFETGQLGLAFESGAKGFIFGTYAYINGRHLSNLLIFYYVRTHENAISGEVLISHRLLLAISAFQQIALLVPMVAIAALFPNYTIFGANIGITFVVALHGYWYYRAARTENLQELRSNAE